MKRMFTCFLTCLMLFSLTGCWQAPAEKDDEEEELWPTDQTEEPQEPQETSLLPTAFSLPYQSGQTLDPVTCPDGMQQVVASLIFEGLFHLDTSFQPQSVLCDSYSHDETAQVYTLNLRSDVLFSDGSPLTGADVRATLLRAMASPRYQSRLSAVRSITASGSTVTITLNQPNTAFPALLDIPIVKTGTEKSIPIGTGPYLYADLDGEPSLLASQNWWQGSTQPTDRIPLVETSDQEAMVYRFTSRDVQLITTDLTGTSAVNVTGRFTHWTADTTVLQYLGCNIARKPLDSAAFRQCLSLSVNRRHLVSAYLSGHGRPAQFPISPASPLYPTVLEKNESAAEVSAALQSSGYTADRTLTLLVNSENPFKVSSASYLASAFSAAGIPTEVRSLPWEDYLAALAAGNYDLYYGEVKLQADWDLSALLATGGSLNYSHWADPTTDQLLLACRTVESPAIAVNTLCKHLQATAPIIPLCFKSTSVLTQADVVEGLTPTATEPFYDLASCIMHLRTA